MGFPVNYCYLMTLCYSQYRLFRSLLVSLPYHVFYLPHKAEAVEVDVLAEEEVPGEEAQPAEVAVAEELLHRDRWTAVLNEDSVEDVPALAAETDNLLQQHSPAQAMTVRQMQRAINNFTITHYNDIFHDKVIDSDARNLILPDFKHIEFGEKVGGRLSKAYENWCLITDSRWVLDVVHFGYKLEFAELPPLTSQPIFDELWLPPLQSQAVHDQVMELLDQGAVAEVSNPFTPRFYSKLFVREKKSDSPEPVFRLIIDLSKLNEFLIVPHFTMESNRSVRQELKQGAFFCKFDLRHAYLHILIHPHSRKYLSFTHRGKVYEWTCLPFGLAASPFVFTKVVSEVGKFVHLRGLKLLLYLDDWLLFCLILALIKLQRDYLLQILWFLGWLVNLPKSVLDPLQYTDYLGAHYDSLRAMVFTSQDRWEKIQSTVNHFLTLTRAPARHWCQVMGLLTSAQDYTFMGRVALRPLQFHINKCWQGHRNNLFHSIPLTTPCKTALQWWLCPENVMQGVKWLPPPSNSAHHYRCQYGGLRGPHGGAVHAGHLVRRTKVISHKLARTKMYSPGPTILAGSPSPAVNYATLRQPDSPVLPPKSGGGGTHSWALCQLAAEIWELIHQLQAHIQISHISGKLNLFADVLSRPKLLQATEWSLHPKVTKALFKHWHTPLIDLFASKHNNKLASYCSLMPDSHALHIDSFSFSWDQITGYAYPPPRIMGQVLTQIESHDCLIILICPLWPRAQWYPRLLDLLIDYPLSLPVFPQLLKQPCTHNMFHPHPERLHLHAWLLSRDNCKREAFLKQLSLEYSTDTEHQLQNSMNQSGKLTFCGALKGVPIHSTPLRF